MATALAAPLHPFLKKHATIVLVATQSKSKLESVSDAFKSFTGAEVKTKGLKVSSGVREQPYGHDETLQGANSRLDAAIAEAESSQLEWDFVVSIESGIIPIECGACFGEQARYYDIGWVIVKHKESGAQAMVPSAGVSFPSDAVAVARESGFETTAGDVLAEQGTIRDTKDPHRDLTGGAASRSTLLSQAIQVAIGQVAPQCIDPSKMEAFLEL